MNGANETAQGRVRHAVVGAGGIGMAHVRSTTSSPLAELVAVVDPNPDVRARVQQRFGVPGFASHHELIASQVAEAVSVATPHRIKDRITRECLEAGLHVYTEKPLAIRIGTAQGLVEQAERSGVRLTVGHQYRTFRTPQTIKQLITAGSLGRVRQVLWTWHQFRPDRYFAEHPWRRSWREAGGGLLALQLAHDLDLLVWLLGPATSVRAALGESLHHIGTEDSASAIIEFEGGAVATLQASINRPPAHVVRQIVGDRAMLVVPAAASIVSDEFEDLWLGTFSPALDVAVRELRSSHAQPEVNWERLRPVRAPGAEPRWKRPRRLWRSLGAYHHRPGLSALLDSFFGDVLGRGESLVPGGSALAGVELRNAMVVAAETGRTVTLPLDPDEVDGIYDRLERSAAQPS